MVRGRESDLYAGVARLLKNAGYSVLQEFTLWPGEGADSRDVDAIGFKWGPRGDIDAWAIEAKDGDKPKHVLAALPQAIEYSLLAPQVSIAARIATENLLYARKPLEDLGLGYVCAGPRGAASTLAPRRTENWPHNDMARWLRHAAALHLMTEELRPDVGADWRVHTRGSADGYVQYAVHTDEPIQIAFAARSQPAEVAAVVWVEKKGALKRLLKSLDASALHDTLGAAGLRGSVSKRERSSWGPLKPAQARHPIGGSPAETASALRSAKRILVGKRMVPVIDVRLPLWDFSATPDRGAIQAAVRQALERLRPVRSLLQAALTA